MSDFLDKLAKMPLGHKLTVLVVFMMLVGVGYYFFYFGDYQKTEKKLKAEMTKLQSKRAQYETIRKDLIQYRARIKRLLNERKEALKKLPLKSEIPSLLESLHNQAELAGLSITKFVRQEEESAGFYARVPVAMELKGNYHQIATFFDQVGKLARIVNIENLEMKDAKKESAVMNLKAECLATTYRFIERPSPSAPGSKKHGK